MPMLDTCPRCGEPSYQRVVAFLHACRSCLFIAEGTTDDKKENTDPHVKRLVSSIFETPAYHKAIIEEAKENGISVLIARPIEEKSWLNEPRFEAFRAGYGYAASQTHAIRALSTVHPEDLYHAVVAILRGAKKAGKDIPID